MVTRGEHRFSSLVKQNKKGKNYAVFCFAGFFFKKKFCYEVIVTQKNYKRSTNHYWQVWSRKYVRLFSKLYADREGEEGEGGGGEVRGSEGERGARGEGEKGEMGRRGEGQV